MKWVDRTFDFSMPVEMFPVVLERLRGAAPRAEEKVRGLPSSVLTRRDGSAWSIQEQIGHLLDLDALHTSRLDDYLAGAKVLRAADITNRATSEAGYNLRPVGEILSAFRAERAKFVERLEGWDERRVSDTALHPRLKQPMRVIDMAYFVAEHDDHHFARMTELARLFA